LQHAPSERDGAETAALASRAREKLRRCLQARQIVRRLRERPESEIVAALKRANFAGHARGLLLADWVELMRPDAD
jgi:hypothetical protein